MAQTENLGLPLIDDTMTADISRDLNALAEAVDTAVTEAVANVEVPLSDVTSGTRSDVAASEKAVGVVMAEAQAAKATANAANTTAMNAGTKADTAIAQLADLSSQASGKGASLIGVQDTAGHFTGTTVEAILAELFTFANDGKTGLASVIGSPAKAADTFAILNTRIQTNKDTLASNLGTKGVTAVGTETLASLVAKVANILTRRYVTGTTAPTNNYVNNVEALLGFKPSLILVYAQVVSRKAIVIYHEPISTVQYWLDGIATLIASPYYVNNNGFALPINFNGNTASTISWTAVE